MFKNIDFDTKKYSILLGIVCIAFFIIVIKAFEYIPTIDNSAAAERSKLQNINTPSVEQTTPNKEEQNAETEQKAEQKRGHIDLTPAQTQTEPLPEIQAPKGVDYEEVSENPVETKEGKTVELSPEEKAAQLLYKAQDSFLKGQYTASLEQYRTAANVTTDSNLAASAYEGIAQVYATNKKYGTALSFATKAYSISPSSSREMLIAKLYYKTGDIEKATKRINNILHRDFSKN